MWLITSSSFHKTEGNLCSRTFYDYKFFCDWEGNLKNDENGIKWVYTGYILQRKAFFDKTVNQFSTDLLCKYYSKYNKNFIHRIKGNFVIIQLQRDSFRIYSDRFGIKKFFYYQNGKEFIISDNLKEIIKFVNVMPSRMNMCIYSLTYHFTGGTTLFEGIQHNTPAQIIELNQGKLFFSTYWNSSELLNIPKQRIDIKDISDRLIETVKAGLEKDSNISLSLTGGADTRNLLAVFLKLGIQPHLYTYGNPDSDDAIKAAEIANGLNLDHIIHDIHMNEEIFEEYARKIIRISGGLASIHRSHRLIAAEKEQEFARIMFLGTLGGEFIKGVSEDGYIVPSIVYENWDLEIEYDDLIKYFSVKHLNINDLSILRSVTAHLKGQPFTSGSIMERKHSSLCDITAHMHDAQDINLFETVMDYVFTPFLDIDYLEVLFASEHCYNTKETIKNKYLRKINYPVYSSHFLKHTFPALLGYRYCREHKPGEVVVSKYYAALLRYLRQMTLKPKPPNFPLGEWMTKFVADNLPRCKDYNILNETFNLDTLLNDFNLNTHLATESYWLKFTNPIMMRFIIEEFSN